MSAGREHEVHKSRIDEGCGNPEEVATEPNNVGVATPGDETGTLGPPTMIDVFAGPNAPLASAFSMCGWQAETWERRIRASDDLNSAAGQQELAAQMRSATFVAVAFDCSTKRERKEKERAQRAVSEIQEAFEDGSHVPGPLRSENHSEGLPSLRGADKEKIKQDNTGNNLVLGLLKEHDEQGGGSMRENPNRSVNWRLRNELEMGHSGRWTDKTYAACVLQGARCRQQRIRHNIEEFDKWPPMDCHHIHDPDEWKPWMSGDTKHWPNEEEAEYTAALVFYIAVSASWWAMRRGHAKMKVPRLPQIESTGDKRPWLRIHSKAFREWAMIPMALGLGIELPQAGGIPAHVAVKDLDGWNLDGKTQGSTSEEDHDTTGGEPAELPAGHVYIGQGHRWHRLRRTKWASPFLPGVHGTASDCVGFYLDHIRKRDLVEQIKELQGKTLVCDCKPGEPCTGDALAAECYASEAREVRASSRMQRWFEQKATTENRRRLCVAKAKIAPTRPSIRTVATAVTSAAMPGQSRTLQMPEPRGAVTTTPSFARIPSSADGLPKIPRHDDRSTRAIRFSKQQLHFPSHRGPSGNLGHNAASTRHPPQ